MPADRLPVVRLLAAVACRADLATLRARRAAVDDEAGLLSTASSLGMTIALDAAAEALDFSADLRRRLFASATIAASVRDAALQLLADLDAAGAPADDAIVIKGGAMQLAFPDSAHRVVADLDVVVPASCVAAWLDAASRSGTTIARGQGYEAAAITRDRARIELHLALPGFAGHDSGPGWDSLRPHASPAPHHRWLVPAPQVSREIAVQHFLFHHGGETAHAIRTLQDLALLESAGEGDGLDWGTPAVARATARMRAIARDIRDGHDDSADAAPFLSRLTRVLDAPSSRSFAEESRHWIAQRRGLPAKLALLARRLAPPPAAMRASDDDSPLTIATRYARRPLELLRKYRASARLDRERGDALSAWRDEVDRIGK